MKLSEIVRKVKQSLFGVRNGAYKAKTVTLTKRAEIGTIGHKQIETLVRGTIVHAFRGV